MTAPAPTRAEEAREAHRLMCACRKVTFPQFLEPGTEWRCPCGTSSMLSGTQPSAEARAARAEAEVARLKAEVNTALTDACRMSAILLMAGEMTAQERRTARAVAEGLAFKVRAALQGGDQ